MSFLPVSRKEVKGQVDFVLPLVMLLSAVFLKAMDILWGLLPSRTFETVRVSQNLGNQDLDFLFQAEIWTPW